MYTQFQTQDLSSMFFLTFVSGLDVVIGGLVCSGSLLGNVPQRAPSTFSTVFLCSIFPSPTMPVLNFPQAGVWPKFANHFLLALVGACAGGAGEQRPLASSSALSTATSTPSAVIGDASGQIDWIRVLDVLREAKLAGVELAPDVLVALLSKIPPGNSRKVLRVIQLMPQKK